MTDEQIGRINELYRKSKAEGLTEEEKKEQAILRKEFIANFTFITLSTIFKTIFYYPFTFAFRTKNVCILYLIFQISNS